MKIEIRYRCHYRYAAPVGFTPHFLRLFPRRDPHLSVAAMRFETNASALVHFRRDLFDNDVARCFYPDPSDSLKIAVDLALDVEEWNPYAFLLEPHAASFPFAYSATERRFLAPYLDRRAAPFEHPFAIRETDTTRAVAELNAAIHRGLRYERRDDGLPFAPAETVARGAGACRDFAVLLAEILREHGVAARLASGYLLETDTEEKKAEGAMHMWVEAYIPGAGWLGLDPTNGYLCNHHHVTASIGADIGDVTPVLGGIAADHLAAASMEFSLEVTAHA